MVDPISEEGPKRFDGRCRAANITGHLVQESGDLVERICQRGVLTDLIVLDGRFTPEQVQTTLQNRDRPILVVPGAATKMERILLAYEGKIKSQEALFVAAYLAEQWGAGLTVLTSGKTGAHAARYLEMHEVKAEFVTGAATAVSIQQTAAAHHNDLILLSQTNRRHFKTVIAPLLVDGERPLFICPQPGSAGSLPARAVRRDAGAPIK